MSETKADVRRVLSRLPRSPTLLPGADVNWHKHLTGLMVIVWLGAVAGHLVDARQPDAQQPPAQSPPAKLPSGYAGTETCAVCHDAESKNITHSRHGQAKDPRSPAGTLGCESCHGPGQAHVDDDAKGNIRRFSALKPADVSETCLTCHNRGASRGLGSQCPRSAESHAAQAATACTPRNRCRANS